MMRMLPEVIFAVALLNTALAISNNNIHAAIGWACAMFLYLLDIFEA